jgi:hypothetical protein
VSPLIPALLGRHATSFGEIAVRNAAIFRGEQSAPRL